MKNINPTKMAFKFLCERNPLDISHDDYVCMLMDFQDIQGDNYLQALAGFYIWAIDNMEGEKRSNAIASTFAHDLGGRKDKFMSPRSSSYLEFWTKEISKWQ